MEVSLVTKVGLVTQNAAYFSTHVATSAQTFVINKHLKKLTSFQLVKYL
jgi:hypothetical protein